MKINVGIDLGTTYSAVATFNKAKGQVEILKNDLDKTVTPSVIHIENGVVTIGEEAKNLQASGDLNTAAFYKSMMGEKGYSLYIDGKDYTPEDLSAEFLKALKKNTEEANGVLIEGAVITVPAYFTEQQKTATLRAGQRAGLKVLKIINEPTSAILAYGLTGHGKKNVMVYDLGGGTFDVTIAEVDGTKVRVLTTNGNHQLGGKDWDMVLIEEMKNMFYDQHDINIEDYPEEYKELQVRCEEAKKKLTSLSSTTITVQCEGYVEKYPVTREFFDTQTLNLMNETIQLVYKCFQELGNGFGWHSIDEVVLVGGSTRMPQVKERVIAEYGKPPVTKNIDVDTIVAAGAAMQAELCTANQLILGGTPAPTSTTYNLSGATAPAPVGGLVIKGSDIEDIASHSLGMLAKASDKSDKFVNSIIVKKNSKLGQPFSKKYQLYGEKLDVYVFQGESQDPYECTLLYKYVISGMPKGKKNVFNVNFQYNLNGIVDVSAELEDGTVLKAVQCEITETLDEIFARLRAEEEEAKKNSVRKIEIMFMIDTSGSMEGDAVREAKKAMKEFVGELKLGGGSIKVAIVDFATTSTFACDFTSDSSRLLRTIDNIKIDGHNGWGTSAEPISNNGKKFSSLDSAKIIVVLTDGVWDGQDREIAAAGAIKSSGTIIYAVGVGDADRAFLSKIASENGARKIDLSKLSSTFKEIASTIATEV